MTDLIVGIDLGTTNSLVARVVNGKPEIVRDAKGERIFVPSVVSFLEDGSVLVGKAARERAATAPRRTVHSIKRLMGKGLAEVSDDDRRLLPYELVEEGRKLVKVKIQGGSRDRALTPQEISADILRELKTRAEAGLGQEVKRAVVTVPAYFDDAQRQATRDAGKIAGLEVLRIINEPTAASLAYGLGGQDGLIAVYDFGGGTFDISILRIQAGTFRVLATNGDTYLGGDDLDRILVERALRALGAKNPDASLLAVLRDAAEKAKIELTTQERTVLRAPGLELPVTRAEYEQAALPFVERTLERCRRALEDAKVSAREIDQVVLVGGVTRTPLVRKKVEELFGRKPHTDVDPDEVVALGAAVQADVLSGSGREVLLLDVIPLSLGMETLGGAVAKLIMRNATIPTQATEDFTTARDNQTLVEVHVLQGERELVKDCRSLAHFKLRIPPMPAQVPKIHVTFLIDQDGILHVLAQEERSGAEARIEVVPVHGLTEEEVDRIYMDSLEHALDDVKAHRLIDLRNEVETILRATHKQLSEVGSELDPVARKAVEAKADELLGTAKGDDADAIQRGLEELNEAAKPLAEIMLDKVAKAMVQGKRIEDVR
ncbi:MAG TPA: molecular chaperone DnaK [Planctomycetota bacterium]|nr:molecular chaperone DnaK [Planctomycetota bacterium]